MKRLQGAVLLTLILSIGFVACGNKGSQSKILDACDYVARESAIAGHKMGVMGYTEEETLIELEKSLARGAN